MSWVPVTPLFPERPCGLRLVQWPDPTQVPVAWPVLRAFLRAGTAIAFLQLQPGPLSSDPLLVRTQPFPILLSILRQSRISSLAELSGHWAFRLFWRELRVSSWCASQGLSQSQTLALSRDIRVELTNLLWLTLENHCPLDFSSAVPRVAKTTQLRPLLRPHIAPEPLRYLPDSALLLPLLESLWHRSQADGLRPCLWFWDLGSIDPSFLRPVVDRIRQDPTQSIFLSASSFPAAWPWDMATLESLFPSLPIPLSQPSGDSFATCPH